MIDSKFHVEINGKKYTLAEDGEGTHYQWRREPLRAPTNGFVLGDTGKFNLRPDLLEWQISDWSGGEGIHSFDPESPNAYSLGYNIDPFKVYGTLRLSPHAVLTTFDSGGATTFEQSCMAIARDNVYLVNHDRVAQDAQIYRFDFDAATPGWSLSATYSATAAADAGALEAWGDSGFLYFGIGGASSMVTFDGSAFVAYANVFSMLPGVNGFIYGTEWFVDRWEFNEIVLNPLSHTEIYQTYELKGGGGPGNPLFIDAVAGQNALYIAATPTLTETVVYKIEPTTAAGAGFGQELLRIPGFRGLVTLYTLGLVYIAGITLDYPTIIYYDEVNGSIGAAWQNTRRVMNHQSFPSRNLQEVGGSYGGEFSKNHFVLMGGPNNATGDEWSVMTIDAVTGGVAGGTVFSAGSLGSDAVLALPEGWHNSIGDGLGRHSVVYFNGHLFIDISRTQEVFPTPTDGQSKVWWLQPNTYTDNLGIMESSINDFGILADKVLTSFTILTDPLPDSSSVVVKYQLDQDGTWHTAGTFSTNDGTEETFVISTDSTTRRFRNLQIRLELDNGNVTTETPVVRSIRALATVIEGVNTWSLMLNATDELGAMQNRSWNGATLIDNITDAAALNSVVAFKDGYTDRKAGSSREYDVVIDEYSVINDRPGEGTIQVNLREVT